MRKFLIFLLSVFILVGVAAGFSFYQFIQSKAYADRPIAPQTPDLAEATEWQTLLDRYSNSPCLQDRTAACLIEQALNLQLEVLKASGKEKITVPDNDDSLNRDVSLEGKLLGYIVSFGDRKAAIKILPYIDNQDNATRTKLLFLSGEYDEALKEMRQSHEKYADGSDYGAVWSLLMRGDYNKAIEVARIVLKWQHADTYTGQTSVACLSHYSKYPRSIGKLAHLLATQGRYKEALEIKDLLKKYIKNKYNGRWFSTCYQLHGLHAYLDAIYGIADAYIQDNQTESALEVYRDFLFFGEEMSAVLHRENNTFENEIKRQGLLASAIKLGWQEDKDYLPYTPKQHCNAAQKDPIPSTAAEWREKLDTCGKNKKHRRYGIHITEKEQMLHCYMDTLETLQIQTVFKRLPWQC
jgi:tetratricopeptide (TPR) repeat protein